MADNTLIQELPSKNALSNILHKAIDNYNSKDKTNDTTTNDTTTNDTTTNDTTTNDTTTNDKKIDFRIGEKTLSPEDDDIKELITKEYYDNHSAVEFIAAIKGKGCSKEQVELWLREGSLGKWNADSEYMKAALADWDKIEQSVKKNTNNNTTTNNDTTTNTTPSKPAVNKNVSTGISKSTKELGENIANEADDTFNAKLDKILEDASKTKYNYYTDAVPNFIDELGVRNGYATADDYKKIRDDSYASSNEIREIEKAQKETLAKMKVEEPEKYNEIQNNITSLKVENKELNKRISDNKKALKQLEKNPLEAGENYKQQRQELLDQIAADEATLKENNDYIDENSYNPVKINRETANNTKNFIKNAVQRFWEDIKANPDAKKKLGYFIVNQIGTDLKNSASIFTTGVAGNNKSAAEKINESKLKGALDRYNKEEDSKIESKWDCIKEKLKLSSGDVESAHDAYRKYYEATGEYIDDKVLMDAYTALGEELDGKSLEEKSALITMYLLQGKMDAKQVLTVMGTTYAPKVIKSAVNSIKDSSIFQNFMYSMNGGKE